MSNAGSEPKPEIKGQPPAGPARAMSPQLNVYYSNCAMVVTSPRDVSVMFGRYVPASNEKGEQTMAELYERQIYMTIEQAEDLSRILAETVKRSRPQKT